MPYLVCYKCDVYYEVTKEEVMEFTHCECGEKLNYFENLEDSYTNKEENYYYEPLDETPYEPLDETPYESLDETPYKSLGEAPDEFLAKVPYEALGEAKGAYIDLDRSSGEDNQSPVKTNQQDRITITNGTSFTQEKATQYRKGQEQGQILTYAGVILFIISLFAIFRTLNLLYGLITIAGVLMGVYGNSLTERSKKEGYGWERGLEGENMVTKYINTLPLDYHTYHDVQLQGKGGNIDHIVIGPTGIFVIETKNYTGTYRIKGNQWLYQKQGKWVDIKKNPGSQVRLNTMDLIKFLDDHGIPSKGTWITSLVALNCPDFRVLETPPTYKVLIPETVPKYILRQKKVSNIDLLERAAQELEPLCVELSRGR